VFELDPDYRYAFISGPNRDYLWLLARTPQIDEAVYDRFLARATELGFDLSELVRVAHTDES